jgi:hypothetical protein
MNAADQPAPARRQYTPSNGTEGEIFTERYCDQCKREAKWRRTQEGADGCRIRTAAEMGDEPPEWTATRGLNDATCSKFDPVAGAESPIVTLSGPLRCQGSPAFPICFVVAGTQHPGLRPGELADLALVHLDGHPGHNEPANVRLWCQRCREVYERTAHARASAATRAAQLAKDAASAKGQLALTFPHDNARPQGGTRCR